MTTVNRIDARHDKGLHAGSGVLECDCGERCTGLAAWHMHTVRTYNNPSELAVQLRGERVHTAVSIPAGTVAGIVPCTKVACHNQGNGRECWTVKIEEGEPIYGLPSHDFATELVTRGGVLSTTYFWSTC